MIDINEVADKKRVEIINEINVLLINALKLAKENKIVSRGALWKADSMLEHNMYELIYQLGIDDS